MTTDFDPAPSYKVPSNIGATKVYLSLVFSWIFYLTYQSNNVFLGDGLAEAQADSLVVDHPNIGTLGLARLSDGRRGRALGRDVHYGRVG